MLRNFLYLNTVALDGYLSALEDGLRVGSESEQSSTVDKSVEADARLLKGNLGRTTGGTRRTNRSGYARGALCSAYGYCRSRSGSSCLDRRC